MEYVATRGSSKTIAQSYNSTYKRWKQGLMSDEDFAIYLCLIESLFFNRIITDGMLYKTISQIKKDAKTNDEMHGGSMGQK